MEAWVNNVMCLWWEFSDFGPVHYYYQSTKKIYSLDERFTEEFIITPLLNITSTYDFMIFLHVGGLSSVFVYSKSIRYYLSLYML